MGDRPPEDFVAVPAIAAPPKPELSVDERFAKLWEAMKFLAESNNSMVAGLQNLIGTAKAQKQKIEDLTGRVDVLETLVKQFETYQKSEGSKKPGVYQ